MALNTSQCLAAAALYEEDMPTPDDKTIPPHASIDQVRFSYKFSASVLVR